MRKNLWLKISSIILATIIMGLIAWPISAGTKAFGMFEVPSLFTDHDFHLGLDLKGGTQLVYNVDLSDVPAEREKDILNGVEEVIRRRIDGLGVTEPVIQRSSVGEKKHIIIELPGISDIQQAIDIVGKVVQLKFQEQKTELTDEEKAEIVKGNEEVLVKANEFLISLTAENIDEIVSEDTEEEVAKINLEKSSNNVKEAFFNEGSEFVRLSFLSPALSDKLTSWSDLKNETLYPEVIESDESDSIIYVKEVQEIEEKEVLVSHILVSFKGAERADTAIERTKEEALTLAEEIVKEMDGGATFEESSDKYSDDTVAKEDGGILGEPIKESISPYHPDFTDAALLLTQGEVSSPIETPFGYHLIKAREVNNVKHKEVKMDRVDFRKESETPTGWQDTEITGEHFDFASANFDPQTLAPLVNIRFNEKGKDLFAAVTERNLNKPIAIFLDDEPIIGDDVYAPTVQSKITDGNAVITGLRSLEEASQLAQNLNTGAIPAPITLIGESTVGATLGHDALVKGLEAALLGLIVLVLYMVLYYRLSGIVAIFALITYAALMGGIIQLLGVTMTLAGMAGVILSIGMAVDANILIFERMREELSLGKDLSLSLEEGFKRAWTSIRDSNTSTLITCFILIMFGTGIIRGFAVTLAIGVFISMFTAVVVTRNYMRVVTRCEKLSDKPRLFIPFINTNKDN